MKIPLLLLLFLVVFFNSYAQRAVLKGRIVDVNNRPVEFATVLLKNLDRTTFTDSAGVFSFQIEKKHLLPNYDFKAAVVGKKTIEFSLPQDGSVMKSFKMEDLSLTLSEIEINQVRKIQNSNSSIVFDRQALEQVQAFTLGDVLNNLPGKKMAPPQLQSPQNITLRSEATGIQAMNNSFGVAIIIDDVQQSNNANMQNRNVGKWGMAGSTISNSKYGSFDVPFSGLDIRDIPVDNIESVEVISGVAPAKYGDLTSGAVIVNRQAGKTPYQFATRINGASTNFSISKGNVLNKKWGAVNYNFNYLRSNADPSDKTKIYDRLSGGIMWTSYFFKNFKNTLSLDYSTKLDDVKLDPDDAGLEIKTFSKARNLSISNRMSLSFDNALVKGINFSIGYSNSYNETYNQRYLNGAPKGIADKDVSGEIYEGYFIPGSYLSLEHIKGSPVNVNGNLSISNEVYTGKLLHKISVGANIYYAQNHGQGVIVDPTKPRWANTAYQNDRPYSYESLPDIYNYGIYLQDNFKAPFLGKTLNFNSGLRYDVQNGQGNIQPRINASLPITKALEINGAYGISTKGPSLAHRYPAPVYTDLILLNRFTGNVIESMFLVYTDKFIPDNSQLKSSKSNQIELGLRWNKKTFNTSLFGYFKKDVDGFSGVTRYSTYTLPDYDYTYLQGQRPIVTPNGKTVNRYVGINTISNDLNSENYGLEWAISIQKIKAIETSFSINNSFGYTHFKNNQERIVPTTQNNIELGKTAWFGVYPANEYVNWNLMTKISTTTHIPKLGFIVNILADIDWQTVMKTKADKLLPYAWLDKNMERHEIDVFDSNNADYGHLNMSSAATSKNSLPFPVANMSIRISKEIKQRIRFSVNAYNFFNTNTRYYNPDTGKVISYSTPTSVGAEISIKF